MHDDEIGFEDVYDPETLAALDAWEPSASPGEEMLPSRLNRWSRQAAIGAVLSGFALGLQEVFEPKDQRQIVIEVDDEGQSPHLPIELFLDPDSPAGSLCLVHRDALSAPEV